MSAGRKSRATKLLQERWFSFATTHDKRIDKKLIRERRIKQKAFSISNIPGDSGFNHPL